MFVCFILNLGSEHKGKNQKNRMGEGRRTKSKREREINFWKKIPRM